MSGLPSGSRRAANGAGRARKSTYHPDFETDAAADTANTPAPAVSGGIFKNAAYEVLKSEERLMTSGEITKLAMERKLLRCYGKTPENTMASALYTEVRKKASTTVFIKPKEGLFGLKAWLNEPWLLNWLAQEGIDPADLLEPPPMEPNPKKMRTSYNGSARGAGAASYYASTSGFGAQRMSHNGAAAQAMARTSYNGYAPAAQGGSGAAAQGGGGGAAAAISGGVGGAGGGVGHRSSATALNAPTATVSGANPKVAATSTRSGANAANGLGPSGSGAASDISSLHLLLDAADEIEASPEEEKPGIGPADAQAQTAPPTLRTRRSTDSLAQQASAGGQIPPVPLPTPQPQLQTTVVRHVIHKPPPQYGKQPAMEAPFGRQQQQQPRPPVLVRTSNRRAAQLRQPVVHPDAEDAKAEDAMSEGEEGQEPEVEGAEAEPMEGLEGKELQHLGGGVGVGRGGVSACGRAVGPPEVNRYVRQQQPELRQLHQLQHLRHVQELQEELGHVRQLPYLQGRQLPLPHPLPHQLVLASRRPRAPAPMELDRRGAWSGDEDGEAGVDVGELDMLAHGVQEEVEDPLVMGGRSRGVPRRGLPPGLEGMQVGYGGAYPVSHRVLRGGRGPSLRRPVSEPSELYHRSGGLHPPVPEGPYSALPRHQGRVLAAVGLGRRAHPLEALYESEDDAMGRAVGEVAKEEVSEEERHGLPMDNDDVEGEEEAGEEEDGVGPASHMPRHFSAADRRRGQYPRVQAAAATPAVSLSARGLGAGGSHPSASNGGSRRRQVWAGPQQDASEQHQQLLDDASGAQAVVPQSRPPRPDVGGKGPRIGGAVRTAGSGIGLDQPVAAACAAAAGGGSSRSAARSHPQLPSTEQVVAQLRAVLACNGALGPVPGFGGQQREAAAGEAAAPAGSDTATWVARLGAKDGGAGPVPLPAPRFTPLTCAVSQLASAIGITPGVASQLLSSQAQINARAENGVVEAAASQAACQATVQGATVDGTGRRDSPAAGTSDEAGAKRQQQEQQEVGGSGLRVTQPDTQGKNEAGGRVTAAPCSSAEGGGQGGCGRDVAMEDAAVQEGVAGASEHRNGGAEGSGAAQAAPADGETAAPQLAVPAKAVEAQAAALPHDGLIACSSVAVNDAIHSPDSQTAAADRTSPDADSDAQQQCGGYAQRLPPRPPSATAVAGEDEAGARTAAAVSFAGQGDAVTAALQAQQRDDRPAAMSAPSCGMQNTAGTEHPKTAAAPQTSPIQHHQQLQQQHMAQLQGLSAALATLQQQYLELLPAIDVARPGDVPDPEAINRIRQQVLDMELRMGALHPETGRAYVLLARVMEHKGTPWSLAMAERALLRAWTIVGAVTRRRTSETGTGASAVAGVAAAAAVEAGASGASELLCQMPESFATFHFLLEQIRMKQAFLYHQQQQQALALLHVVVAACVAGGAARRGGGGGGGDGGGGGADGGGEVGQAEGGKEGVEEVRDGEGEGGDTVAALGGMGAAAFAAVCTQGGVLTEMAGVGAGGAAAPTAAAAEAPVETAEEGQQEQDC